VALGLALRLFHYARNPSLWHDEAAVVVNVLRKGFLGLLGPLEFANPSPPLFLWIEKVVAGVLGEETYAWRLVPLLASCAALVLLVPVARRLLRPEAVPWALLLFAVSDRLLWHSCEAKPYALDVCCATGLLALFLRTESWTPARQLLLYTALAPILIFLSYPGCFLCGGLMAALLPAVWRDRKRSTWLAFGLCGLTIAVAFGLLWAGPVRAQRVATLMGYWTGQFPDWERPWRVAVWPATATFEVLRYCCKPTGGLLTGLAVIGAASLWRGGQHSRVLLLLVPVALAMLAACLKYYPFGHSRTEVYTAPAMVLLLAAGMAPTIAWLRARVRFAEYALALLLLAPAGWTAYRLVVPWERTDSAGAAAFVLAQRRPSDSVVGNQWEHQFYFRQLGPLFHPKLDVSPRTVERVWLVLASPCPEDRVPPPGELADSGWHIQDRSDAFERTTILLLKRDQMAAEEPRIAKLTGD
jgi:hypothetical protein